jgi:hypothetical protein
MKGPDRAIQVAWTMRRLVRRGRFANLVLEVSVR